MQTDAKELRAAAEIVNIYIRNGRPTRRQFRQLCEGLGIDTGEAGR